MDKTKEMVVGFRRAQSDHSLLTINNSPVEVVVSTKFLGVHLAENVTWTLNNNFITKKAQQRPYFLRKLRKAHILPSILTTFYSPSLLLSTEALLSENLAQLPDCSFGNCSAANPPANSEHS